MSFKTIEPGKPWCQKAWRNQGSKHTAQKQEPQAMQSKSATFWRRVTACVAYTCIFDLDGCSTTVVDHTGLSSA